MCEIYNSELIDDILNGFKIDFKPFYRKNLSLRSPNILFKYTDEEIEICLSIYNNFYYLVNNILNEPIRDFEHKFIKSYLNNRFNINLMSPNMIHNRIYAMLFLWKMISNNDYNMVIVSPTKDQSIHFMELIKSFYIKLPYFIKPGIRNWQKDKLILDNGSRMSVMSANSDIAIGYNFNELYIDDMSYMKYNNIYSFYNDIMPVMSSLVSTKVTIVSPPNLDDNNFFNQLYKKENSFYIKTEIPYYLDKNKNDNYANDIKYSIGEDNFHIVHQFKNLSKREFRNYQIEKML